MSLRCVLPVLVLIYFALDVANPLMPGVVQLVDGMIKIVQADRARTAVDEAPLLVTSLFGLAVIMRERPARGLPLPRRALARRRRFPSAILRSRSSHLEPPSEDD